MRASYGVKEEGLSTGEAFAAFDTCGGQDPCGYGCTSIGAIMNDAV